MKLKLLGMLALAAGSTFAATHVSVGVAVGGVGVGIGYRTPAPVFVRPAYPGPGYDWIDGYWIYDGPRRVWHNGYWRAPIRIAPRIVAPRGYVRGYDRGFDRGVQRGIRVEQRRDNRSNFTNRGNDNRGRRN